MQETINKTSPPLSRTIASIVTPPGSSGVGIVRVSGPLSYQITNKLTGKKLKPRIATLVSILNDTAIAIYFKTPNSFTGEDIVEFQCHGSYFLLQKVLKSIISHGAVLAEPGEFSRRAFLNGKLSLDQAEAIIDIINAQNDTQLKNAGAILNGNLRTILDLAEKKLIEISAQLEAAIDYPEDVDTADTAAPIKNLLKDLIALIDTAQTGRIISNGIHVAVLGKPNVGKSSIFNALLNTDRSIVTDIAGTTTDTITESISYKGINIIFHDTAGIREGQSKVESLGIQRSKKIIESCDIALIIKDASQVEKDDTELLDLVKNKPHIVVNNKSDLKIKENMLNVSAKTGYNISEIKKQIYDKVITSPIQTDKIIITNTRHLNELKLAVDALDRALQTAPLDCIATDINAALNHIGNITGTNASEAVLDEIFSRFCLGK